MPKFSVIVPTLGRSQSYEECKESLYKQTEQDYEIVNVTEEGPLAKIRNLGAKRARGQYLCFIDDDVVCSPHWLEALSGAFGKGYAGVSGPSFITREFRKNRDCFKFNVGLFSERKPGILSSWGQWSLAATNERCRYDGPVEYLEACNMSFERQAFWSVNGFDEQFRGIGDWSEPDLCFRLRAKGLKLWFSRNAVVEHRPSQSGAYKKRLVKCDRMENYELFSKRWIKPSVRHSIYKWFVRNYFKLKEGGYV
jgi:GT2 family glycosyltransferase